LKVTSQEEYGLRCMMQVASSGPEKPLTVHEIASREGLSDPYVAKLMNLLREGGLVESVRGRSGGYLMTRPPDEITIREILAPLGERLFESQTCERFPGDSDECVHLGECSIRSLWGTLEGLVEQVLQRTTLADMMKSEQRFSADLLLWQRRRLPMAADSLHALTSLSARTANDAAPDDNEDE